MRGAVATLTIDLDAVVANWTLLRELSRPAECAAVVKADGYGLGLRKIGRALETAGCRRFFVARLEEGLALRGILGRGPSIYVLDGPGRAGDAPVFEAADLVPILNSPGDVAAWRSKSGATRRAILNVDTGMNRLGLSPAETRALADDPGAFGSAGIEFVMSHLACAEDRGHPQNGRQRELFEELRAPLPRIPASLANSAGIFLGPDYRYALTRPGAAIYGVSAAIGVLRPMRPVVRLEAPILQTRIVDRDSTVGYGADRPVARGTRLATVAVGYADGFLRGLGNRGHGYVGAAKVPVVGRVSMDLATFDVSALPDDAVRPGRHVELICRRHTVDDLADEAGTIGYEILTALGRRFRRRYTGGPGNGSAA